MIRNYCQRVTDNTDLIILCTNIGESVAYLRNLQITSPFSLTLFQRTFTVKPTRSVHTQKTRQLFYQPEPGYWIVMVSHSVS